MALTGKRVGWIAALMVLALAGLVALQVALLESAMALKEQTFRNNVLAALATAARALAEGEVYAVVTDSGVVRTGSTVQVMTMVTSDGESVSTSRTEMSGPHVPLVHFESGKVSYRVDRPQHLSLTVFSSDRQFDSVLVNRFHDQGEYEFVFQPASGTPEPLLWEVKVNDETQMMRWDRMDHDTLVIVPDSAKRQMAATVMSRLFAAEHVPLAARLDSVKVDSVLKATLTASGIDMDFAYGIVAGSDSILRAQPAGFDEALSASDLRVRLFPLDVFAAPAFLSVHFPDRQTYLWAQILPLVSAEVVFMLVIIACFGYTLLTITRQRRFARRLVDFINNMTHEFKTPISTVALAAEAIARPEVLGDRDRVLQFNGMIRSEIGRMRSQTEKILQMASIEEGDLALDRVPVNLHEVVRSAVNALALQVEQQGGRLQCELAARDVVVEADRVHLAGVVTNLLDNAVKYSGGSPDIRVATRDTEDGVELVIADRGIGMSGEHAKQAFEKYFRVPTGNRHDVKGFGLGLSYVKLMVEAHGGRVRLESATGKGTTVTVVWPRSTAEGATG